MKNHETMIKNLLLGTFIILTTNNNAQDIVFATGIKKTDINLQEIKSVNSNFTTTNVLLNNTNELSTTKNSKNYISYPQKYVAAISMDTNGNLVYIPMKKGEVHTINTKQNKATIQTFLSKVQSCDGNSLFTRMTTGYDGNIYAINNSGSEVIRINTNNNTVQNLGGLLALEIIFNSFKDNKESYGGDMIADAFGNLYIITAMKKIIKVNIPKQTAEFLGEVKGLPNDYMINAAAVQQDGTILLGTTTMQGLYSLDMNSLETKFLAEYNDPIYDMYSPYFLHEAEASEITKLKELYHVYPTIVKNGVINISSKVNNNNQKLTVNIYDINGNLLITQKEINKNNLRIELSKRLTKGVYLIKATNHNGVEVINTKFTLY